MEDYVTVYLFTDHIVTTVLLSVVAISIGIGAFIYGLRNLRKQQWIITSTNIQNAIPALFGLIWTTVQLSMILPYLLPLPQLLSAYNTQLYRVSEGFVEVLFEQPSDGHAPGDKIRIGTSEFEINYFSTTPGYKQTITQGGLLRPNVNVRIYDYKGVILRIDMQQPEQREQQLTPTTSLPGLNPTSIFD